MELLIPGDRLVVDVQAQIEINGLTNGDLRVRYELRVTVPEPSAALSIPLGAAWLAGLAAMKGGA